MNIRRTTYHAIESTGETAVNDDKFLLSRQRYRKNDRARVLFPWLAALATLACLWLIFTVLE